MHTPTIITAHKLWAQLKARGVRLSVQWVHEGDGTHWPRLWMRGTGLRPGDFEAMARVKTELVALLSHDQYSEGTTLDNCDYALTRPLAPPQPLPSALLREEFARDTHAIRDTNSARFKPKRLPYGLKTKPKRSS